MSDKFRPTICIDTHELAWAAGFFDGEGSVMWRGQKRPELSMTVTQADRRPLERFHKAIGCLGTIRGPYRTYYKENEGKPVWVIGTHGFADTQAAMALLWKWLSEPKREQAYTAITSAIPHYRARSAMGKGRSIFTVATVERLRAEHAAASVGRKRVPKGWFDIQSERYRANRNTLAHICKGAGYV
jgi:hypothetical protein